jgi:RHS repeat-associated protein
LTQVERVPLRDAPQEWVDREFRAIVTDLTGSATEMVDLTGSVTWRPVVDLWGASLQEAGPEDACPLRFPGQYHDPETGLNYNYFRYYDPATARYQAPDPLGLAPQPNPHAYTHNPIIRIDPLGLSPYQVGDVDSMVNNMNEDTWFHYTDEEGLKSIMGNGDEAKFVANRRGKVFFTQDMLSPSEVETNVFIGNPLYAGKGEHMIAFQRPEGAVFVPGEQPNEVIHWGSIRIPRSQILYSGKNPF